jgi:hypothetical protein
VVDDHARAGHGVGLLRELLAIAHHDEGAAVAGALMFDLFHKDYFTFVER